MQLIKFIKVIKLAINIQGSSKFKIFDTMQMADEISCRMNNNNSLILQRRNAKQKVRAKEFQSN